MNIFFTSDTHAFHKNICRGVTEWSPGHASIRDFDDQFIMTDALAERINSRVGADDTLICLGDWSFGGPNKVKIFREMINCKKIYLTYGNHDHKIQNEPDFKKLFYFTGHYLERKYNGIYFCMSHYPLGSWNGMGRGSINLYGHCHGSYTRNIGRQMDVGVDTNGLYPYSLEEILDRMLNINPVLVDHHDANSNMR